MTSSGYEITLSKPEGASLVAPFGLHLPLTYPKLAASFLGCQYNEPRRKCDGRFYPTVCTFNHVSGSCLFVVALDIHYLERAACRRDFFPGPKHSSCFFHPKISRNYITRFIPSRVPTLHHLRAAAAIPFPLPVISPATMRWWA